MYVDYKGGRKKSEYDLKVKNGVINFAKRSGEELFNTIDGESGNYGCDVEASYLCHGIWKILMKNDNQFGTDREFVWKHENLELLFHFDIMNNPNISKRNVYSCGLFKDCNGIVEVKKIYHTIGNMTPVPWFKVEGNHYIDAQKLHKSLDERWDLFLQVLRTNWKTWNSCEGFTFEEYMRITCQQVCYEEIYQEAISKKIEEITETDIKEWESKIRVDSKLISFAESGVEKMKNIIRLRCKIVSVLLGVYLKDKENGEN